MADALLIDTLELGSDTQKQKYEIYGEDEQTPVYAVIYQQQGSDWQPLEERLTFAAQDEQQEATESMGYGSGDTLPDLRDLPAEARARCEQHWHEQHKR